MEWLWCVRIDGGGAGLRRRTRVRARPRTRPAELLSHEARQPQLRRRPGLGVRQQPLQLPQSGIRTHTHTHTTCDLPITRLLHVTPNFIYSPARRKRRGERGKSVTFF